MTSLPDDELLSAYLDGELTADEGARVERLLAERPESRQLLEELRLVRESLQALPRRRLDDDFSQHVLRQAEREVLHGGADADPIAERAGQGNLLTASSTAQAPPPAFDWQRMRRPMAWAAIALAAGLLIMFMSPHHQQAGNQQVAHRAAPRGEAAQRPAAKDQGGREERAEWRAVPAGEPSSAAGRSRLSGAQRQPLGDTSELQKRSLDENAARDGSGFGSPANQPAGPQSERFMRRATREQTPRADATTLNLAGDSEQATLGFGSETPAIDDQTLIVWCEVSPDGDFRNNFDKLLAAQQIEWQDSDVDVAADSDVNAAGDSDEKGSDGPVSGLQTASRQRQSRFYFAESATQPAGVDARRLAETLERRAEQESESVDRQPPLDALREPATELVLVEASEQQIKAMLAGLDQTPDTYPAVRVEPAAGEPRQQSLKQFERGAVMLGSRAARPKREAKQSAEKRLSSDKLGESANEENEQQDAAIRAGTEFKSSVEGTSKKEQLSSGHPDSAPGRAKRVLLQRTPPLSNHIVDGEKLDDEKLDDEKLDDAKRESTDDAEAGSAPASAPLPAPTASAATNPAPSPAPAAAPAARGMKANDKPIGDESGEKKQSAFGRNPQLSGRKLATQEPADEGAAEGESGEASARSGARVYRVLFVFHPQPAGEPAEAAKAQPAEPETPEE